MPKEKPIEKIIPQLLKHNALDSIFFGYCFAIKTKIPSVSIEKVISMFMLDFKIEPEQWDTESARVTYSRMMQQYFNYRKDDTL